MNKGISPVGIKFGTKRVGIKPNKAIDTAYARELVAIRNRRSAEDVFEKINPENKMEKVKNKIQIAIDTMTEKFSK